MEANEKQFDCIKMKNDIQKQVFDETKNMSVKELLYYFNGSGMNLNGDTGVKEPQMATVTVGV